MTPEEIRALRERLGLTQAEFAQRVGVSFFAVISRWENGHDRPLPIFVAAMKRLAAKAERREAREKVRARIAKRWGTAKRTKD